MLKLIAIPVPSFALPVGEFNFCIYIDFVNDCDHTNDTLCVNLVGIPTYAPTYSTPFIDNFDGINFGWTTGSAAINSGFNKWEWGLPNFGATNSTHSGPKCWDLNLNTDYSSPADAFLYSPYFDFSLAGINGDPELSFWRNNNTTLNTDGFTVEYSLNNSSNWVTLGAPFDLSCGTNWYDAILNSGVGGFTGNSANTAGSTNGWVKSIYRMNSFCTPAMNGASIVQFRFRFLANSFTPLDGASIDDFSIIPEPQHDASIKSALNLPPFLNTSQLIDLKVKLGNEGSLLTNPVNIYYSINNGSFQNTTYNSTIQPDSNTTLFLSQLNPIVGINNVRIYISMSQDENQSNDTIDIFFNAIVPPAIPYTQDFEQPISGWITSQFGSLSTKWELGSPTYGSTNSVHAGSNCWDINLTTPYGSYANTKLLSPPFSYSLLNPSELRCWVNYNTEFGADGVQLQYSFDGFTFLPLGIFNDPKGTNWFDAANVTSFNGPAWCGTKNGCCIVRTSPA